MGNSLGNAFLSAEPYAQHLPTLSLSLMSYLARELSFLGLLSGDLKEMPSYFQGGESFRIPPHKSALSPVSGSVEQTLIRYHCVLGLVLRPVPMYSFI